MIFVRSNGRHDRDGVQPCDHGPHHLIGWRRDRARLSAVLDVRFNDVPTSPGPGSLPREAHAVHSARPMYRRAAPPDRRCPVGAIFWERGAGSPVIAPGEVLDRSVPWNDFRRERQQSSLASPRGGQPQRGWASGWRGRSRETRIRWGYARVANIVRGSRRCWAVGAARKDYGSDLAGCCDETTHVSNAVPHTGSHRPGASLIAQRRKRQPARRCRGRYSGRCLVQSFARMARYDGAFVVMAAPYDPR